MKEGWERGNTDEREKVAQSGENTSWREKKKGGRDENNGERGRKKGREAKIRTVVVM